METSDIIGSSLVFQMSKKILSALILEKDDENKWQ